jgi:geranylgeranyl diphosphate synthase, type II
MSLEFLADYENIINENIKSNLNKIRLVDKSDSVILDGMEYALLAGGKRIRPAFCIIGALIGGLDTVNALDFASGIEFIHTYSLVHDDLPGMDDDELRRGKPTCHVKYGVGEAILIGDSLLTHGISLLLQPIDGVSLENQLKAARLMLDSIGLLGMIGGQAADLQQEKLGSGNFGTLEYIHKHKTSKLLEGSLISGAILAGASESIINDLSSYGQGFGLAFQITDDILDLTSSVEELGKPIGSDLKNEKLTYPKVFGLDVARSKALEEINKCKNNVGKYGVYGQQLIELADYLIERRK